MATGTQSKYSIPEEANLLFHEGILGNPHLKGKLPAGASDASRTITFEGSDVPSLPINWRFAESISALKAYEATIINVLLQKKYGVGPVKVKINTDHAQLFIMSAILWTLDPAGQNLSGTSLASPVTREAMAKYFPDRDIHKSSSSLYRTVATNIYQTKDDKFFHLHSSLNPDPILNALGLPTDQQHATMEEALVPLIDAVGKHTAEEMQLLTDDSKQAGTICWTTTEFKESEHGKANAQAGLFEIETHSNPAQKPGWWPDAPRTSPARPLAGLKVVDLTRIIAGPAVSRGLAELGASVMRITAPHLADLSMLHPDLNHGKWNASLDLRKEGDRQKLRELVLEADVFLQGYRPGVLDKYGFGEKDVLEMCKSRDRGIVYCAEDCYGWHGPWAHRSGWQQISDAIALNYYSQWLVNSVGTYPEDIWKDVWQRNGSPIFRHYHSMPYTLARVFAALKDKTGDKLFNPEFFTKYHPKHLGKDMVIVAPILTFPNREVEPRFDIGTRGNGVDEAKWPASLEVETVI
ncbi:Succinyl-CoA-L-malate CoA-transferase beta subunit [Seiridium cupressi]